MNAPQILILILVSLPGLLDLCCQYLMLPGFRSVQVRRFIRAMLATALMCGLVLTLHWAVTRHNHGLCFTPTEDSDIGQYCNYVDHHWIAK